VSSLTWGRKQIQFPKRCFSLLFRKNPDDGQSPKTQYLCIPTESHMQLWRILRLMTLPYIVCSFFTDSFEWRFKNPVAQSHTIIPFSEVNSITMPFICMDLKHVFLRYVKVRPRSTLCMLGRIFRLSKIYILKSVREFYITVSQMVFHKKIPLQ
jgi:hypothetical protein